LCSSVVVKRKGKFRSTTHCGIFTSVEKLRPLETLMMSSMTRASMPARLPSTRPSKLASVAAAQMVLLITFINWPWPGSSPR